MKLWHDDIRRPPSHEWFWARTNEAAKEAIQLVDFTECSLDHDLGLHEYDPDVPDADMQAGWDTENNGYDLVKWMVEHDCVPDKVTIHSWNPAGATNMERYLLNAIKHKAISNTPEVIVRRYMRSEDMYP